MGVKVTEEMWADARRRYEIGEKIGYGQIAQILDCSKNLVVRRAKAEGWQKRLHATPFANRHAAVVSPKVTDRAVHEEVRGVHVYEPPLPNDVPQRAAVPSTTPVAAEVSAARAPVSAPGEIVVPNHLNDEEREAYVREVIRQRQAELDVVHRKEISALKRQVYGAVQKAGTKEAPGAALAAQRAVSAMLAVQAGEIEVESRRVQLEWGRLVGQPVMRPAPAKIIVHQRKGVAFGKPNDEASIERRAAAADRNEAVARARALLAEEDTWIAAGNLPQEG
jgi:hypothetical protein